MFFRVDPFRSLWNEIGRMSDDFQKTVNTHFGQSAGIAVWTDENNVYAEADLPGIDPAKIDVTLDEGRTLTIRGERPLPTADKSVWIRHERPSGEFTREIELPVLVNADSVQTKFANGVLTLTLPKSEAAKPRKIAVG
jgi:HSP20 family protein